MSAISADLRKGSALFTGIVEELGQIEAIEIVADTSGRDADARVSVRGAMVTSDARLGDSIAVDGVCLTVVDLAGEVFAAELMAETLAKTTAHTWQVGSAVNLERSVTPATRLGGHVVQGHVDGVGTITARVEHPGYDEFTIAVPGDLGRYIAPKGAVAVDGISLTVIGVADDRAAGRTLFTLGVIPATRTATTLGGRRQGERVNIEVDVMAKYAERLLAAQSGLSAGAR